MNYVLPISVRKLFRSTHHTIQYNHLSSGDSFPTLTASYARYLLRLGRKSMIVQTSISNRPKAVPKPRVRIIRKRKNAQMNLGWGIFVMAFGSPTNIKPTLSAFIMLINCSLDFTSSSSAMCPRMLNIVKPKRNDVHALIIATNKPPW